MRSTRLGWGLAAAAALVYLGVMGLDDRSSHPPSPENPVLLAADPASIRRVDLRRGDRRISLQRDAAGRWSAASAEAAASSASTGTPADALTALLDKAIRYLHDAPPVRTLDAAEMAGLPAAEYGLDPPSLTVTVDDGVRPIAVSFGRANAQQLQYARIAGDGRLHLMSGFVGQTWSDAATAAGVAP